jgi:hypothetical protein
LANEAFVTDSAAIDGGKKRAGRAGPARSSARSAHLNADVGSQARSIDGRIFQAHGSDIAPAAAQVDGAGAGPGAKYRASVHVLPLAVGIADVEIAQVQRLVDGADADRALTDMTAQADRVGVPAIDPGVGNGAPAAFAPAAELGIGRGHRDEGGGDAGQAKDQGALHVSISFKCD